MNFGEALDQIRRQKDISIKQVCGNYLSRQTYYRFVNNETDISSKKLFYLLNNLNVNVDEFLFICNNFQLNKEFADMEKIKISFQNQNILELERLLDNYSSYKNIKEQLMYAVISILLGRLTNKISYTEENIVRNYLVNIETWTHYEIVLFNNIMFIFDSEFIELVVNKTSLTLEKYSTLRYYGSESIRMLLNMIILYIDRQDIKRAQRVLKIIKNLKINDDCMYEKSCIIFFSEVINLLNGAKDSLENCKSILKYFNLIGSHSIATMFNTYLDTLIKSELHNK
ncbi:TPA: Rgg/GadR/MutR family transcriptional regulator [Streptococcus agalactiae]|nr:Rgg/GadR/MutR family transcriptional regulator [Streptococcus agalactiae]